MTPAGWTIIGLLVTAILAVLTHLTAGMANNMRMIEEVQKSMLRQSDLENVVLKMQIELTRNFRAEFVSKAERMDGGGR